VRIFVRSLNWLGDAVFQAPALRLIKARWPEAELLIQAKPSVAEVVRAYGLGELVPWHEGRMARAAEIRALKADRALLLPKSFGSALDAFLARVPQREGWAGQGRSLLLTRRLPRWEDRSHYALRFRALAASFLGAGDSPATSAALALPAAWGAAAEPLLAGLEGPFVLLAPGASGGLAKQWEPIHWRALARTLAIAGYPSLVVGKAEEADLGAFVADGDPAVHNLVGRTDLKQLGGLAGRASLVLANDSGLLHLAAALGAPLLGIYGPTSPETSYPLGSRAWAMWNRVQCAPCFKRVCPIDHPCMMALGPEAVAPVARALLEGREPGPSPFLVPRPTLPGIAHN
jgi:heptosyltransferase-2